MLLEPAVAVIFPPPQEPVSPFGVATNRPVGSGSVKLTFVSGAAILFVIVNVKPTVWCRRTMGAAKDLVKSVALATVTEAEAGVPEALSLEVGTLVVLVSKPVAAPLAITSTSTSQVNTLSTETRTILTDPDRGTAVTVPVPHVWIRLLGVATTNPVGKVSVKPTPVRVVATLGWVMENCRLAFRPGYRGGAGSMS